MIWNHWKYIYNQNYNIRFQKLDMMIYKISFRVGWYFLSSLEKKKKKQSHKTSNQIWNISFDTVVQHDFGIVQLQLQRHRMEKFHWHFDQRILTRIKLSIIDAEFWNDRHWDIQYERYFCIILTYIYVLVQMDHWLMNSENHQSIEYQSKKKEWKDLVSRFLKSNQWKMFFHDCLEKKQDQRFHDNFFIFHCSHTYHREVWRSWKMRWMTVSSDLI